MSDSIAVMKGGRIQQVGTPEEVYRRPATRFVASFLGAMNWIGGIGLRPEALRISREPENGSRPATVTGTTFLGPAMYVETRLESGETCTAQLAAGAAFRPGDAVHLSWNAADELRLPE